MLVNSFLMGVNMKEEVEQLIADYASVYTRFEDLQKGDNNESVLPGGDQKTGVIAEYYAKLYIEKHFGNEPAIGYEPPGAPHDIEYEVDGKIVRVQVKAVSAHSKTRVISPIKLKYKKEGKMEKAFDKLYLISLDENFIPDGFWINDFEDIEKKVLANKAKSNNQNETKRWKIEGAQMKGESKLHSKKSAGSPYLDYHKDLLDGLKEAIRPLAI